MIMKYKLSQFGRSLALGCSLAAGLLAAGSAQADVQTLSVLQGWVDSNGINDEAAPLTNTFTGSEFGHRFNSWVAFYIPAGNYTSATLNVNPSTYGNPGPTKIALYDVTTPFTSFLNTQNAGVDIYNDLGSGREYAAAMFNNDSLSIKLNGRALADINASGGHYFLIGFTDETLNNQPVLWNGQGVYISGVGRRATQMELDLGQMAPVPEPSQWGMLLAGMLLLGVTAVRRTGGRKLKSLLAAMAGAGMLAALPAAQATTINQTFDFENVESGLMFDGDWFEMNGVRFTSVFQGDPADGGGFTGAVVDGRDQGLCTGMVCPSDNLSKYYAGVNDGVLFMNTTKAGDTLHLASFDASFIASDGNNRPIQAGVLQIQGMKADGSYVNEYYTLYTPELGFAHYSTSSAFANTDFVQLGIFAYSCDLNGMCNAFNSDKGQFALDNVTVVPEPSAYLMLVLGFGMLAVLRRRAA